MATTPLSGEHRIPPTGRLTVTFPRSIALHRSLPGVVRVRYGATPSRKVTLPSVDFRLHDRRRVRPGDQIESASQVPGVRSAPPAQHSSLLANSCSRGVPEGQVQHGKGPSTNARGAVCQGARPPGTRRAGISGDRRRDPGERGCTRSRTTRLGWPQERGWASMPSRNRWGTPGRLPCPSLLSHLEQCWESGRQTAGRRCTRQHVNLPHQCPAVSSAGGALCPPSRIDPQASGEHPLGAYHA